MKISANNFSKKVFNKGTGFTAINTPTASGFAQTTFRTGTEVWGGDNTAESAYGVDDMFGGPFSTYGITPYGGISHHQLRTRGTISH